jgi:predicted small lipoprotein YifL
VTRLHAFCRFLLPTAAFAAVLFVASCGVKGPLELPEGTKVTGNEGKGKFVSSPKAELPGYYQSQTSSKRQKAQKQLGNPITPDEPFVLDPLLN